MKKSTLASLILVVVTAMWGLTFPLIENAVALVPPGLFVTVRMCIATAILIPFVFLQLKYTTRTLVVGCLTLALLNTGTYIFQSQGLTSIPASRSAFITGMSVIMVPLLMPLFRLGKPDKLALISVLICLLGLYILTGANLTQLSLGDFWTFDCAVTYALFIIVMQIMSTRETNYLLLCFYQIGFSILFALPFAGHIAFHQIFQTNVLIGLIFCGIFATSLSIYLQGRYQQYTTAAKTALIFSLEPVFATIFAYFINHTAITMNIIFGGVLILASILLRDAWQLLKNKSKRA